MVTEGNEVKAKTFVRTCMLMSSLAAVTLAGVEGGFMISQYCPATGKKHPGAALCHSRSFEHFFEMVIRFRDNLVDCSDCTDSITCPIILDSSYCAKGHIPRKANHFQAIRREEGGWRGQSFASRGFEKTGKGRRKGRALAFIKY